MARHASEQLVSLSLTPGYAPSWGTWEGLRELVQNWHDGLLDAAGLGVRPHISDISGDRSSFVASGGAPGADGAEPLGTCAYDASAQELTLVNRQVGIERKALLLGFSKKAMRSDVIGAFGEGMKVGALALLRAGIRVDIQTREETWHFCVEADATFGERVLSVRIAPREVASEFDEPMAAGLSTSRFGRELGPEDTVTVISGLKLEEWLRCVARFLFLCPPAEEVATEQGRLLLDKEMEGQVFVKGVWIADHSQDRLSTGVDFAEMRLDRDRTAVLRRSDIDHHISSMWARAIIKRPDLTMRYYELLAKEGGSSDVSLSELYCDEVAIAAIAAEFTRLHGNVAIPVTAKEANRSGEKLQQVRDSLNRATIICSEALIGLLRKSPAVCCDLDALLQNNAVQSKRLVSEVELPFDERDCIAHACSLAAVADPSESFSPALIDIAEYPIGTTVSKEQKCKVLEGGGDRPRVELCRSLLRRESAHSSLPGQLCLTPDLGVACRCHQVALAQVLLDTRSRQPNISMRRLIACLAFQACGLVSPSCVGAHMEREAPPLAHQREESLQRRARELEGLLETERVSHSSEVRGLQSQLQSIEKEVVAHEFRIMDVQDAAEAQWKGQATQLRESLREERESAAAVSLEHSRELAWLRARLEDSQAQLKEQAEATARREAEQARRAAGLQALLAKRRELLQTALLRGASGADAAELREIREHLSEEARRGVCCICLDAPSSVVLLPCRHKQTCGSCAANIACCPLCRIAVQQRLEVFE